MCAQITQLYQIILYLQNYIKMRFLKPPPFPAPFNQPISPLVLAW